MIHCMGYVPDHNTRCFLQKKIWDILLHIEDSIRGPWAVIRNFNELLYPHEKMGEMEETNIECKILENLLIAITY